MYFIMLKSICFWFIYIKYFSVNGKPEPLQSDEAKMIKNELKLIRNHCNALLDKLDSREPSDNVASSTTVDSSNSFRGKT